jgi:hypothetical protein
MRWARVLLVATSVAWGCEHEAPSDGVLDDAGSPITDAGSAGPGIPEPWVSFDPGHLQTNVAGDAVLHVRAIDIYGTPVRDDVLGALSASIVLAPVSGLSAPAAIDPSAAVRLSDPMHAADARPTSWFDVTPEALLSEGWYLLSVLPPEGIEVRGPGLTVEVMDGGRVGSRFRVGSQPLVPHFVWCEPGRGRIQLTEQVSATAAIAIEVRTADGLRLECPPTVLEEGASTDTLWLSCTAAPIPFTGEIRIPPGFFGATGEPLATPDRATEIVLRVDPAHFMGRFSPMCDTYSAF